MVRRLRAGGREIRVGQSVSGGEGFGGARFTGSMDYASEDVVRKVCLCRRRSPKMS